MTISTLMNGLTPSTSYAGVAKNDDYVLGLDLSADGTGEVGTYTVAQVGISSVGASLEAETDEKTYIRSGKVTNKTGTTRKFTVAGDRIHGDAFQDGVLAHKIKYGTGSEITFPYVYFSMLTGKGEKGKANVIVNSDGNGDAGASAGIEIEISTTGKPEEYTYSAS